MNKVLDKIKATFLELRIREEQKIESFSKSLEGVDIEKVFGDLKFPDDISLIHFCPELYKDEPDPSIYDKQFEEMSRFFEEVNRRIEEYNKEGLKWLQEYKMNL